LLAEITTLIEETRHGQMHDACMVRYSDLIAKAKKFVGR
jgi:hypothetical protein